MWGAVIAAGFMALFLGANLLIGDLFPSSYQAILDLSRSPLIIALALISALFHMNCFVFLGKEKIHYYNSMNVVRFALLFFGLLIGLALSRFDMAFYLLALSVSYILSFILSLILLRPELKKDGSKRNRKIDTILFHEGKKTQTAAIVSLLNTRLSHFLIIFFWNDMDMLGIYSVAIVIAESVWIYSRSSSTVQYSKLSNSRDSKEKKRLSSQLLKTNGLISVAILTAGILLPDALYSFVFGEGFEQVRWLLMPLALGVIANSMQMALTSYFSAMGNFKISLQSSVFVLIVNITSSVLLIPEFGITGAAWAFSITYTCAFGFYAYCFYRPDLRFLRQ